MNYTGFVYEIEQRIATVRFSNPDKLNAVTFRTYEELGQLTENLARDDTVDVLVMTGSGTGFCSGGSVEALIGRLVEQKGDFLYQFTRMTCDVVQNMQNLKKPIIAAVNGIAAGAGAVIALASDLRIVSDRGKFAFLFGKVGLSGADMGALYLLPRIVGLGKAKELLFLGDTIDAQESHRIGLANWVVPHEQLIDEAKRLARRLQEAPLSALGITKELLHTEAQMDMTAALETEARAQAACMETPDFLEGYRAFMEKRKPLFNRPRS